MQVQEGNNNLVRIGNYLINWNNIQFIRFITERDSIEIGYKSGLIHTIGERAMVIAFTRYIRLYPDLMDNTVYESLVKFAGGLRSKIKTDMMGDKS